MKNILLIILFLYILTLFQTSFLVHFKIAGLVLNLVLIFVILINFLEEPDKKTGLLAALAAGFFLDVFSVNFFGYYVLISLAAGFFFKYILRRQIRIWI